MHGKENQEMLTPRRHRCEDELTQRLHLGKIPHAAGQLNPCAATPEPLLWSPEATAAEAPSPEPVLRSKRSRHSEKPADCDEEQAPRGTAPERP